MIDQATAAAGRESIEQGQLPLPRLTTTYRVVYRTRDDLIDRDPLQSPPSDPLLTFSGSYC